MNQKLIRGMSLLLGGVFLIIGGIGIILPVLPTTPFLLVASFFFARGSKKFHVWLNNTAFYQKHVHDFVVTKSMSLKTKWSILIPASTMMIIALVICPVMIGQVLIAFMIAFKYYYFFFRIKTINPTLESEV